MAYTPTTWENGDTITAEGLNNIEGGIASGGVLVVHEDNYQVLDKTWKEITDAGFSVLLIAEESGYIVCTIAAFGQSEEQGCSVIFNNAFDSLTKVYGCASPTDYPDANYSPK